MAKYLSTNDDGVIYLETDDGEIFGVVNNLKIIDCDGLPYSAPALWVLSEKIDGVDQDRDAEQTIVNLDNGRLVFSPDSVEFIPN